TAGRVEEDISSNLCCTFAGDPAMDRWLTVSDIADVSGNNASTPGFRQAGSHTLHEPHSASTAAATVASPDRYRSRYAAYPATSSGAGSTVWNRARAKTRPSRYSARPTPGTSRR